MRVLVLPAQAVGAANLPSISCGALDLQEDQVIRTDSRELMAGFLKPRCANERLKDEENRVKRRLLAILFAILAPMHAVAAEAQLWLAKPDRPGDLESCPRQPPTGAPLDIEAVVRWEGGSFPLHGSGKSQPDEWALRDRCFVLAVDGQKVAAGAVLSTISARLVTFPVLQIPWDKRAGGMELVLTPQFPARPGNPLPPQWRELLPLVR